MQSVNSNRVYARCPVRSTGTLHRTMQRCTLIFFMTEEISLLTLTTSFMFDVIKGMHAKAVYNYVFMQLSQIFPCAAIFYKDIS